MYKPFLDALDLLEQTGSADEVFRQIQQIGNASRRESTLKMLAKYFARQANVAQAQRFSAAIHNETTSIYCLQGVARELRRKGYSDAAGEFLQRAYEKATGLKGSDPGTAFIWLVVSIELHDAGRLQDALGLLHRAIGLLQQTLGKLAAQNYYGVVPFGLESGDIQQRLEQSRNPFMTTDIASTPLISSHEKRR